MPLLSEGKVIAGYSLWFLILWRTAKWVTLDDTFQFGSVSKGLLKRKLSLFFPHVALLFQALLTIPRLVFPAEM